MFTEVRNKGTSSPVILCLVVVLGCLLTQPAIIGAKAVKRSVSSGWDSPCFVLEEEGANISIPLINTTRRLIEQTGNLIEESTNIKSDIGNGIFSTALLDWLNKQNFIDAEEVLITDEAKAAIVAEPIASMLGHYALMYELVAHIEYIRTHDKIGTLSSEAELRKKLLSIENLIYSTLCTIKMGLLSANQDTTDTVTTDVLSQEFKDLGQNFTQEKSRAYVVMKDSETMMQYLNTMYTAVEESEST